MKLSGHALRMVWSGEYGYESSSTGYCRCGWEESAGSQAVVRDEYRYHIRQVAKARAEGKPDPQYDISFASPWVEV